MGYFIVNFIVDDIQGEMLMRIQALLDEMAAGTQLPE